MGLVNRNLDGLTRRRTRRFKSFRTVTAEVQVVEPRLLLSAKSFTEPIGFSELPGTTVDPTPVLR